jgi:hypothetical protein
MNKTKEETKVGDKLTALEDLPLWRLRVVRALQVLGVLTGFVGGAEFLQLMALVPHELAGWLLVSGPAVAAGARPTIELVGDLLDDGVRNNSFKIPLALLFGICGAFATLGLSSCGNLTITEDGCVLATYKDKASGQTFYSGPCAGEDGKVARYVTEWTNEEGVRVRVTREIPEGAITLQYQDLTGGWVQWSSKAGLSLGAIPKT